MKRILIIPVILLALVSCQKSVEFKVTNLSIKDSINVCKIAYKLPVLTEVSGQYSELCQKVNDEIGNETVSIVADLKKEATSFYDEFVKDAENPSALRYEYYGDYDQFYADNKIISFRYINYFYTGGAHGNTKFDCYNYDVNTGNKLTFSDVFKTDEESIKQINSLLVKYFKNPDNCFIQNPEIDSKYKLFTIQKDTVIFTFHQYELGAYACGAPEIKVPKQDFYNSNVYKH